jgi:hypothetical protein
MCGAVPLFFFLYGQSICLVSQRVWSVKGFGHSRQDLEIRNQNILPQAGDISSQSVCMVIQVFWLFRVKVCDGMHVLGQTDEKTFLVCPELEILPKTIYQPQESLINRAGRISLIALTPSPPSVSSGSATPRISPSTRRSRVRSCVPSARR